MDIISLEKANKTLSDIKEATIARGLVGGVKKVRDISWCSLREAYDFVKAYCKPELIRYHINKNSK